MRIVITGTPGVGKSSIADMLGKKLKLPVIHLTEFSKKKKLIVGKEGGSLVVDTKRLRKELEKVREGIIEGHLACEFPLKNAVVLVLRCNPAVLEKRLKARHYPKQKIHENLECEAIDYCTQVAEKHYKQVHDIDATKLTKQQTLKRCLAVLRGRKGDRVDFSEWLLR